MKLYLFLLVCGHLEDQLEEVKMIKQTKEISIVCGDLSLRVLNFLNKVYVSIISSMLHKRLGYTGIQLSLNTNLFPLMNVHLIIYMFLL
jgi:hypothetical protein